MKKTLPAFLALLVLLVVYLLAWPVPVDPIAWTPPLLEGEYAPNTYLADVERLDLPSGFGPEDVAVDSLGRIYGGLQDGRIVRMTPDGRTVETVADTEGRPLGLAFAIITSVEQVGADLYLGSLTEPALARIAAPE